MHDDVELLARLPVIGPLSLPTRQEMAVRSITRVERLEGVGIEGLDAVVQVAGYPILVQEFEVDVAHPHQPRQKEWQGHLTCALSLPLIPKESFDFGQGVTEEDGNRCREWAEKPCIANDFSADEDSLVRFETEETSVWRRSTRIRREFFSVLMVLVQGDDGGCLRPYGFILNAGVEELAQRSWHGYSPTGLSRSAPRSADRDSPALLRLSVCMLYASAESSRSAQLSALPVHRRSMESDRLLW